VYDFGLDGEMTVRHGEPRLVAAVPVPNSTAMAQPIVRS
jgi:hypothetical protein